jgi:hypothetical protein
MGHADRTAWELAFDRRNIAYIIIEINVVIHRLEIVIH